MTSKKLPIKKGMSLTNHGTMPKKRYHAIRIRGSIAAMTVSLLP